MPVVINDLTDADLVKLQGDVADEIKHRVEEHQRASILLQGEARIGGCVRKPRTTKAGAETVPALRRQNTTWIADATARRVPLFVQEMTGGLKTKKEIVNVYGEGAIFEPGGTLPTKLGSVTAPAAA